MSLPSRLEKKLRLTEDQATRLRRVTSKRGQTEQAFVLAALLYAIEEAEAELRVQRDDRQRRREAEDTHRTHNEPMGLGIRQRLLAEEPLPSILPAPPAPLPLAPVVVQVGGAVPGSGGGDVVSRLTAYVVAGPEYERDRRLRTAVDILRVSSGSDEERQRLAEQLDTAVKAALAKERPPGGIARMSFDLIKSFIT